MNILIGLIEHIGDIVACEPVSRYLKNKYCDTNITWAVSKLYRELIDSNPNIDKTVTMDCITDWIKYIKHAKYDYIVDLHVNYKTCQYCNIPLFKTIGNPFVNTYDWFDYGSLLEAFSIGAGLPKLSEQPRVYIQKSHIYAVNKLGINGDYVVIHRQSNNIIKDWVDIKWDYVIENVIDKYNLTAVEVGSSLINNSRFTNKSYINLVNKTSILECAEIIKRARLFVGIDSGPAHLANAVNTQGVILLGNIGYFKSYNPFCGGFGENGKNVRLVRNLSGPAQFISTRDVLNAVDARLLNSDYRKRPAPDYVADEKLEIMNGTSEEIISKNVVNAQSISEDKFNFPRVLAFYLPQFYPIPENDAAWGKGFTDWTNVLRAKPIFTGHYQPRLPGELGLYDLRFPEVLERQVSLAIEHGISGFCFYYYYFNGKRPLYKPIENFIKNRIKFPFCFLWANENWTKRWDGGDDELILAQNHSPADNIKFIRGLLPVFKNDSYIKINGKPLLLVYKTHLIPDIRMAAEQWRNEVKKAGFSDIYLVHVDDWFGFRNVHPKDIGFDASYEIPSNIIPNSVKDIDWNSINICDKFCGSLVDYEKFARFHMERPFPEYKKYKTVMLPWDNTARYRNKAIIYMNANGEYYKKWLLHAYIDTYKRYSGDDRLLFIHSWNEWCEGTNLEPDQKNGRKYLEFTKDTIEIAKQVIEIASNNAIRIDGVHSLYEYVNQKEESVSRVWAYLPKEAPPSNYVSAELDSVWNSYSMRLFRPIRNLSRRLKGLPQEQKPEVGSPDEAKQVIEAIRQSFSWELTGPLRVSKQLIDRLIKGAR